MHNKTFRLFISSTFSDFAGEREILQLEVFPELEAFCKSHGYQFQAIDLRWGVNEEAQLDQKTIEICLNEVQTCKHYPHPNFIIMLGDRYGWIPLPYAIEKSEFEYILNYYSGNKLSQSLLNEWYQHDKNHLIQTNSTAYVIKPRSGKFIDSGSWIKVENKLRDILQEAASNNDFSESKHKYFLSATEHEVNQGIYHYTKCSDVKIEFKKRSETDYNLDLEYVYGFIREIDPGNYNINQSVYFDSNNERLPKFVSNLKDTLLKENLLELKTNLVSKENIDNKYLEIFGNRILFHLKSSIQKQIKSILDSSDIDKAKSEHFSFKQERLKIFIGRHDTLESIKKYVSETSTVPLVIFAQSGMGKTSLMAKAIDYVNIGQNANLIYRFIGVTERSSNIRSLLSSIIKEIDLETAKELENIFDDDKFNGVVKKALSEIKNKTVIFIDALDQLQEKNYLKWLPDKLSPNLKLIISVLEDKDYPDDSGYLDILKVNYKEDLNPANFIKLEPLDREDGNKILSQLLFNIKRTLTLEQRKHVLDKFEESGYSPLYLIITFEEIKKWKSFDLSFYEKLEDTVIYSIKTFLKDLSRVYHHQKLLVSRTMGYLECAKNGLSEKEMIDVLSSDNEVMNVITNQYHKNSSNRIPLAPWARLYSQLSPFLIEKMSDNVSLITLFHRQFKNAIQTEILNDPLEKKKLHLSLAQYFNLQPLISSKGVINSRKLSEQAFHLYNSDQLSELIKLFEQDYISIKYDTDRFFDCLHEIEETFSLIHKLENENQEYKNRLFLSVLKFLDSYSHKTKEYFDFELIHGYFIYRMHSKFYPEFLERVSDKKYVKEHFLNNEYTDEYYLRFLSGSVGYLRRTSKLKEASTFVEQLIEEYSKRLDTVEDTADTNRLLSTSYYELGYIHFLRGEFIDANTAFEQSVDFAQKINNEVSEWITKCVMTRIAYLGGLIPIDKFDSVLDQASIVFKKLASNNRHAKRWVKNTLNHKFEIANALEDRKMMKTYYKQLRINEWNKEHDVDLSFQQGLLAMVENKYDSAIKFIDKYLQVIQKDRVVKEESIARVFYYQGLAYYKNGNIPKAKSIWDKTMSLDDEPGNHAFKKMTQEKLAMI